jgi:C-terminal processing protease CtpA/Prc
VGTTALPPGIRAAVLACTLVLSSGVAGSPATAQDFTSLDRSRGLTMLWTARSHLKRHYYDPSFHGVNVDSVFRVAEEQIRAAQSNTEVVTFIAAALQSLDDSHTFFFPPQRVARVEYGWDMRAMGDSVYVIAVRPGSHAERLGVRPGDRVQAINGIGINRANLWQARYFFRVASPRTVLRVMLATPDGTSRTVDIQSEVIAEPRFQNLTMEGVRSLIVEWENLHRLLRNRDWVVGRDVYIWRMATFGQTEREIDQMMDRATEFRAVVIDLRGNSGGSLRALERLVSRLFDREVVVAVLKTRGDLDTVRVRPRGKPFAGELVVLVDSYSASAAEMFTRVVQVERRGRVIGDRTAGAVMGAYQFSGSAGEARSVLFGVSVTAVDVRMSDGGTLERVGLMPDEFLIPSGLDLAARRDPVLARAVALLGGSLLPEEAGRLFPFEWLR